MSLFNLNFFRVVFCVALLTACSSNTKNSSEGKQNAPKNNLVVAKSYNNKLGFESGLKIKYKNIVQKNGWTQFHQKMMKMNFRKLSLSAPNEK